MTDASPVWDVWGRRGPQGAGRGTAMRGGRRAGKGGPEAPAGGCPGSVPGGGGTARGPRLRPRDCTREGEMKTVWGVSAGLAVGLFAMSAQAVETVRLTMSSSHPTAVAWVGALKTNVIDNSNRRLEEMGSDYQIGRAHV